MKEADFVILGAGAIGSIIGAHLARAGHSVLVLVRERRARQIEHGLTIKGLVEFTTPVAVLIDPAQLKRARTLIVAMKTPGTAQALGSLRHVEVDTALSIQNGLLKNDQLAQVFGQHRTLGALADTSGELLPTGEVLFTRNVAISIGELAGGESARAQQLAQLIDASGVRAQAVPDVLSREWSKFVGWAGFMILSVMTRAHTWKYLVDADAARVIVRLVKEMGLLANAAGVEILDQSIVPAATILRVSESEAVQIVRQVGQEFMTRAPGHRMSSLQDLEAHRALEIEETLGYAVRKANEFGLSLPLLENFYRVVAAIDRTRDAAP